MHNRTVKCKKGAERKRKRLALEEDRAVTSGSFSAYGCPLDMATSFKYLGQVISAVDNDLPVVVGNLDNAQEVWRRLMWTLGREGVAPPVSGFLFKAVVQSVLIFGAETWVVTPQMDRVLWGFQDQMAWQLTGRLPRRWQDGKCEYT